MVARKERGGQSPVGSLIADDGESYPLPSPRAGFKTLFLVAKLVKSFGFRRLPKVLTTFATSFETQL